MYYLQSRYYNPTWGRFLNADVFVSTGQGILGNNMFAYCNNNPVMGCDPTGYDPTGYSDCFGHQLIAYLYYKGCGGFIVSDGGEGGASSVIVIDVSFSVPSSIPNVAGLPTYGKFGVSFVADLNRNELNMYSHLGSGIGVSAGPSIAAGTVNNYREPEDYSKWFIDGNLGFWGGLDHCWDPMKSHENATQATSVTFGKGFNVGFGVDWYFEPMLLWKWED